MSKVFSDRLRLWSTSSSNLGHHLAGCLGAQALGVGVACTHSQVGMLSELYV